MNRMDNEMALQAWKKMRSEIDTKNWLFVGIINPEMIDRAIEALETVIKESDNEAHERVEKIPSNTHL